LSADAGRAADVARAFALGGGARFTGRLERGEQGQVEELVTARGAFAVKTSFGRPELDGEDAEFQAAARAAGVPAPAVMRAVGGAWHAEIGGLAVRVYDWVDVLPPSTAIDPVEAGRTVAAIHRTPFAGSRPEHPWYTEPVGAPAWDRLLDGLAAAGAPVCATTSSRRRGCWSDRRTCAPAIAISGWTTSGARPPGACA
jgi:hypothetical protein